MLRGCGGNFDFGAERHAVPPIEFDDLGLVLQVVFEPLAETAGHDPRGRVFFLMVLQCRHGIVVEMVVVIVRNDHEIDLGQLLNLEWHVAESFRSRELYGGTSFGPDLPYWGEHWAGQLDRMHGTYGICQEVQTVDLHEES